jgi:outer membrane receptor for ferric coprogen and ferric-rhodotorulic acid
MTSSPRALLLASAAVATLSLGAVAHAGEVGAEITAADAATSTPENQVEGVVITGGRTRTASATGLDLSLRETPQSVTVIDQQHIRDFALNNVNDLLTTAPGINVERTETDRTSYNSRGFDITNFQVDGVGMPLSWGLQTGDLDTGLFDRLEIVRGANGMLSGTGNPSATINYIRKRPTQEFQGTLSASYGSWDDKRIEADVSGPLNASGTVTGRLVYANEDKDSYLDRYKVNRNVYYGVLSWEITDKLKATAGYSRQDNLATGNMWGALPLQYTDGTLIDYPVSANTGADWNYWDTKDQNGFAELSYDFAAGWSAKGTYTHKDFEENAKLLYAFGNPDPVTGLGVFGMAGKYPAKLKQDLWEASVSGPVELLGREHQVVFGASSSKSHSVRSEDFSLDYPAYPAVGDWGSQQPVEPAYPGPYESENIHDRLDRLYGAAHLTFSDKLKGVIGFNYIDLKTTGTSYAVDQGRSASKFSPYAGLVYDLTSNVSLYGSYTDIFNPQADIDINVQKLAPAKGTSYEGGVKSEWFGGKLYATAAIFRAEQKGLAAAAGVFGDGENDDIEGDGPAGFAYYAAENTTSKGYELEVSGALTEQWRVSGGWTQLSLKNDAGDKARVFIPRKSLKLSTTYTFPELRNLVVGANLRWQSDISTFDVTKVTQKAYTVVDLMAGVDIVENVKATVNVQNVFDKKYLNSVMWNQAYYAAPRGASVRLAYTF